MDSKQRYIYEKNGTRRKAIKVKCIQCGKSFFAQERRVKAGGSKFCSAKCVRESRKKRVSLTCHQCGKQFERVKSKLINSTSGLYFCCRKCKDKAQAINSDCHEIWPSHYKNGITSYRRVAFSGHAKTCSVCGYNKVPGILIVHHKDRNRENNKESNLQIMCPNCHAEEHHKHKDGLYNSLK